ncbi:MAG: hypothetical protein ACI4O7_04030 [Aristaeellaceae bacterium]
MISFKCQTCGGEMTVERTGDLVCAYCGSKTVLTDRQLAEYRDFRQRMVDYLRNVSDDTPDTAQLDALWADADTTVFRTADGAAITARYLYTVQDAPAVMYLTRSAALYRFPKAERGKAALAEQWIGRLQYPAADVRNLPQYFPSVTGRFELEDGGILLAIAREEQLFPLSMFGALQPRHAAWVVSRMENICCVLEYSSLVHGGISPASVFINPVTHEAALLGGWWNAGFKRPPSSATVNADLAAVRKTADAVLGPYRSQVPQAFDHFLRDTPCTDAYDDFAHWDQVIHKSFGRRRFVKMDLNGNSIP